ncbi:SDR family NAD(P)-dependent oxidoreductase [Maritimibacter sp. HL-12]|uniref:SDR family NAD(P)-dependent oxidoreductase n=1 Tax=Maritimibacter sp. HL-12 TaxID=1162418 RepID=UPI000A0F0E4F|nr:SDR family NAD(P)-dependent oxidoreductase [Maritimibacter sp. HL-12]SMH28790.1 NAD(P)-dependent dehydrogenase, short-chain alcohol dehydrogenase family [Maritimibacter sp. HL-12]
MLLEGKVVIVTGAGRGIGRAIALAAAGEGARVVVNDIGVGLGGDAEAENPADTVVAEIGAAGGVAIANRDSVAEWDGAQGLAGAAMEAFGRIDAVVNNAAILRDTIFHRLTPEDWNAVIQVNLNGAFYVSRAVIPQMREQGAGAFVHIISNSGLAGNFGQSAYAASKAGLAALSKSIAIDAERFGVRSNCVAPSAWTRMTSSIPDTPENRARIEQRKQVTPDKNAPLVVYLASPAAEGVSGQIFATRMNEIFLMSQSRPMRGIHRDGGWTPQSVADHAIPALRPSFYPLERNEHVFPWDPV